MNTQWTAGVDWGRRRHHVSVMDHRGRVVKERPFKHGGKGLAAMCDWLLDGARRSADSIRVAIETPSGPVVEALMKRGFPVHSINPRQLDRFRDRFSAAGAKDDRRDAKALASALRTDPDCLRPVRPPEDAIVRMRSAARARKELVEDRGRIANRLQQLLADYYPQFLEIVGGDVAAPWAIALWKLAPTPDKARRRRPTTFAKLLRKHRVRRIDAAELAERLQARPIECRKASVESAEERILGFLPILVQYNTQLRGAERKLEKQLRKAKAEGLLKADETGDELSDAALLASIPGVGNHVLAVLLTEADQALRDRDYDALRCLSGVAPVTRRSGNRIIVSRRRACNQRLAEALYHWARVAVLRDPECRDRYNSARGRGKTHGHALRLIGDRLLRIACAMLRDRTLFQPRHGQLRCAQQAETPPRPQQRPRQQAGDASTPRRNAEPSVSPLETRPNRPAYPPTPAPGNAMGTA